MAKQPPETVVPRRDSMAAERPTRLSRADAAKVVKSLAIDTANILVVDHAKARQRQRRITRPQIERCVQRGVITEGPFLNTHGHWQVNLTRYAAGEEITCVVAIEWARRLIVITTF